MMKMKLPRRTFLRSLLGAVAFPALSSIARAQTYPIRPVRWVVPYPPGGATDLIARLMGQWLSERMGQPIVIENRAGAGGNIGTQAVINSPPDGYTMLLVAAANAANATLYEQLPFNFLRDTAPVAGLISMPLTMNVNPSVPAKTVAEFIAYVKSNSGRISMGSPGTGTVVHLSGELFKAMAGVDLVHVPYRGGAPAMTDLISGQVQVMFDLLPQSITQIKAGSVRALAVTTTTRADQLPNVPTVNDTVPGYEAVSWFGVAVPRGTVPEAIERLNREINAGLANPTIKARIAELGATPIVFTPSEFGAHVAAETEKWAKVVKFANIKAE
jgi:tripartite-type tricarboxylate transporter receptor subunit TctC